MTTNEQMINQEAAMASIQKAVNVTLPVIEAEKFIRDTLKKATTMPKLTPHFAKTASGLLDALGIQTRKLRQATGNENPTGVGSINPRQIPFNVRKVFWDEWIKNDDVWANAMREGGENVEDTVMQLVQQQLAVDLQDLAFNGDTAALLVDGVTPDPFLSILDGFVKKMKTSTFKTDLGTNDPTIQAFIDHTMLLDEKYLNLPDVTWFMTRKMYQKLVGLVQQRPTILGDATLLNGKLTEIAGYPIEVVQSLQSGFVALTPMTNLVPVFTRELRYNRTADGATAAAKDSTYHIVFAYEDMVVREINAVAWMTGTKIL